MQQLNNKYSLFQFGIDFEDFLNRLEEEEFIKRNIDQFSLASKGSQGIRKDSLRQIFSSLKPDFYGDHLIPTMVKILRKQMRPARMNSAITLPILI